MIHIPDNMSNEESKLIAAVIVSERQLEIAQCKLEAYNRRMKK